MVTPRPHRRSVSPFGLKDPEPSPFDQLEKTFNVFYGGERPMAPSPGVPTDSDHAKPSLSSLADTRFIPSFVRKIAAAAANDAPDLGPLCQFLVSHRGEWEARGITDLIFSTMENLFHLKTELFLVDHQTKETLKKLGLSGDSRDVVLFAKERDILIGRFFSPITELNPGRFSEFVRRWVETSNLDRLLHFLDFAAGGKDPTFEHYLVFAHPALHRILTSKDELRGLFKKVEPAVKKLNSPTWEARIRQVFEI